MQNMFSNQEVVKGKLLKLEVQESREEKITVDALLLCLIYRPSVFHSP